MPFIANQSSKNREAMSGRKAQQSPTLKVSHGLRRKTSLKDFTQKMRKDQKEQKYKLREEEKTTWLNTNDQTIAVQKNHMRNFGMDMNNFFKINESNTFPLESAKSADVTKYKSGRNRIAKHNSYGKKSSKSSIANTRNPVEWENTTPRNNTDRDLRENDPNSDPESDGTVCEEDRLTVRTEEPNSLSDEKFVLDISVNIVREEPNRSDNELILENEECKMYVKSNLNEEKKNKKAKNELETKNVIEATSEGTENLESPRSVAVVTPRLNIPYQTTPALPGALASISDPGTDDDEDENYDEVYPVSSMYNQPIRIPRPRLQLHRTIRFREHDNLYPVTSFFRRLLSDVIDKISKDENLRRINTNRIRNITQTNNQLLKICEERKVAIEENYSKKDGKILVKPGVHWTDRYLYYIFPGILVMGLVFSIYYLTYIGRPVPLTLWQCFLLVFFEKKE
ncbi:uncharacterized protein [Drosophila takahashii]|uniref:uncharacterized protein isoform X2 n=1 Tax=Drosophila takahashii TaxID=29030 RepID=UPI0038992DAA